MCQFWKLNRASNRRCTATGEQSRVRVVELDVNGRWPPIFAVEEELQFRDRLRDQFRYCPFQIERLGRDHVMDDQPLIFHGRRDKGIDLAQPEGGRRSTDQIPQQDPVVVARRQGAAGWSRTGT